MLVTVVVVLPQKNATHSYNKLIFWLTTDAIFFSSSQTRLQSRADQDPLTGLLTGDNITVSWIFLALFLRSRCAQTKKNEDFYFSFNETRLNASYLNATSIASLNLIPTSTSRCKFTQDMKREEEKPQTSIKEHKRMWSLSFFLFFFWAANIRKIEIYDTCVFSKAPVDV